MSVRRLAPKTTQLLQSTQIVPSYESAVYSVVHNSIQYGATSIRISILPAALRFTVSDNGPGFGDADWPLALQAGCTSLADGRGQSLAALAAVASVELHTRGGRFVASKLVRGGKVLEDVEKNSYKGNAHEDLQKHSGTVVDVWELFFSVPVRRRVESSRSPARVADLVRNKVVALSLANPHVAVKLEGDNGVPLYTAVGSGSLSIDMIQTAFGSAHDLDWQRLQFNSKLKVDGFVARCGSRSSGFCLISFNGLPMTSKGWVHKTVERAWKVYSMRRGAVDAGLNKFAGYVLNCSSSRALSARGYESRSGQGTHSEDEENALFSIVHAVLVGLSFPFGTRALHAVSSDGILSLASERKRRHQLVEERFSEAMISKRIKRPQSSLWASRDARERLIRPISEGSGRKARKLLQRQSASRICIKRPVSAETVDKACKHFVPGWSNPCLRGRARVSRKAISVPEDDSRAVAASFDKRSMRVAKETIPDLRIVGQVDRKFIIVADADAVMYAVDQHAASERYLYETFLKQGTGTRIQSRRLAAPVRVELSHQQLFTAKHRSAALQHWGWKLRIADGQGVEMESVPFLGRLGVVLDHERQLLTYLDSLADGAIENATPQPILDTIASAACHAAVRFGDTLSDAQCRSVISSLASCESPFTCAHGRPSIVPLVALESSKS